MAWNQVESSLKHSEKVIDIQILSKCINEGNISKNSLIEFLRENSMHKKRGYNLSDTIQANSIKIIYKDYKVIKIIHANTYPLV